MVQVSTDEVYGSIAAGSWTEDAPLAPNSPYSAAKAGGDLMARAYARTHGLNVSITRCCNNYGPYQFPEKVIPLFVTNLLDGLKVPLYGDGGNVRDWIHVDDHCRGIQLVLEQGEPGRVYHINGDAELTNRRADPGAILDACGADWDMVTTVRTARATTAATRWTTRCCGPSATPRGSRSPTACADGALVRGQPRVVGAAEAASRPRSPASGRRREPVAGHRRRGDARPGSGRAAGTAGARP